MARILLSCHQFFPRYYTGTEILTLEVADELSRRGHEVAILTTEPLLSGDTTALVPELRKDVYEGYQVWRIFASHPSDIVERLDRESFDNLLIVHFDKVLKEWRPDIVHAFHLMRLTAAFIESVKRRNIPFYFTATDFWLVCPSYQLVRYDNSLCFGQNAQTCFSCLVDLYAKGMSRVPVHYQIARNHPQLAALFNRTAKRCQTILARRIDRHRRLISKIDGVFYANIFLRDIFHKNGLKNDNERFITFPIPERAAKVFDLGLPPAEGPLKIAFIGTLRPTKGPQVLIDACLKISNQRNLMVYIWGASDNSTFESDLRERVKQIEWVSFCGTFPQEKFSDVLNDVHAVVIPSIWYENTPLTALSTLAAHRILIASDLGGLSSLVEDGVNGFLFPASDANALASILVRLAKDRELVLNIAASVPTPNRISGYVDAILDAYGL